jgi:hypothetical protein
MSLLGNAPKAARFLRCDTAQSEFLEIALHNNGRMGTNLLENRTNGKVASGR